MAKEKEKEKEVLTYRVMRERSPYGHVTDRLIIRESRCENVAQRIAGCVGNADGYGSDEYAAKMLREYTALRASGHGEYFESSWDGITVEFAYLVYNSTEGQERPEYCEPRLEMPSKYSYCSRAMKLLQRIGARVEKTRAVQWAKERGFDVSDPWNVGNRSFEHLHDVIAALDALGAVRVERWTHDTLCIDVRADSKAKARRAA